MRYLILAIILSTFAMAQTSYVVGTEWEYVTQGRTAFFEISPECLINLEIGVVDGGTYTPYSYDAIEFGGVDGVVVNLGDECEERQVYIHADTSKETAGEAWSWCGSEVSKTACHFQSVPVPECEPLGRFEFEQDSVIFQEPIAEFGFDTFAYVHGGGGIVVEAPVASTGVVRVYNILGQLADEFTLNVGAQSHQEFKLPPYASGSYLVAIEIRGTIQARSLTIAK